MNKRKFIKTSMLGTIVGLVSPSLFAKSNYPKIGYLSVLTCQDIGTSHADWIVVDNDTNEPTEEIVFAVNDKEGWIEYADRKTKKGIFRPHLKRYGSFKLEYHGKNPKYQHFK